MDSARALHDIDNARVREHPRKLIPNWPLL